MLLNPLHLLAIGVGGCPMLVDWCKQRFLLAFQGVPHGVAGGWRTGIVVVSPGEISWCLHLPGKVHHIVISQGMDAILVLQYPMVFIEMRISARSSLLNVCSHIAERRMIGHTLGYSAIQACCDYRQGTALASALHSHILAIPLWKRRQEVDAAHQSLIHMAHVVAVLIFQAIGKIAPVSIVESLAYLLEGFGRKTWVEAMDFYLEADESVLGIILIAQGSFKQWRKTNILQGITIRKSLIIYSLNTGEKCEISDEARDGSPNE